MTAPTAPPQQRENAVRPDIAGWARQAAKAMAVPIGSVIFAFLIGAVIFAISGNDPVLAYQAMVCGGFGLFCFGGETPALQVANTIFFLTPLIVAGLSVAFAFRAGLFNIGVQGQLIVGAILAAIVGIRLGNWPGIVLIPLVLLASIVGGAVWAGIAGVLKAMTGAHEVVTTIMLNYVAYNLLKYLVVNGPMQAPNSSAISLPVSQNAQLPTFIPANSTFFGQPGGVYHVDWGLLVALAGAVIFFFIMRRMALGYEIRAVGQSQRAARYAGVSVRWTIIVTMLISGAFAGLTGGLMISGGSLHYLYSDLANDSTGFDGIAVALLGLNSAIGVVLASILFGALHAGGSVMQSDAQISGRIVQILQAVILFSLAANFLRTLKLRLPGPGRKVAEASGEEAVQDEFQAEVNSAATDIEGKA
ncbi:MAG TPA: ABC transporter permease [Ktedonobacterales bacterium]|nr:ABC transporter permease [Ktedonobacterales bacterium]